MSRWSKPNPSISNQSQDGSTPAAPWSQNTWSMNTADRPQATSWANASNRPNLYQQQFPTLQGQEPPGLSSGEHLPRNQQQRTWANVVSAQATEPVPVRMGKSQVHRGTFHFEEDGPGQRPLPPAQAQNAKPASSSSSSDNWPPSLRKYVERAFVSKSHSRPVVEKALKKVITRAVADNSLWSADWDTMPNPVLVASMLNDQKPKKARENDLRSSIKKNKSQVPRDDSRKVDALSKKAAVQRAARFEKLEQVRTKAQQKKGKKKDARSGAMSITTNVSGVSKVDEHMWDAVTINGSSRALEKQYLRLTSAPDPSTVRPLQILKKSLKHVLHKFTSSGDYHYVCEQLKSIRQDLTVQRIRTLFTVHVYEAHARIALEQGDLGEYNQCQTVLKTLYDHEGLQGNRLEFIGYRILYYLYHLDKLSAELGKLQTELSEEDANDPAITHALQVREALAMGNYCQFFKLYRQCPNSGVHLMNLFADRVRFHAMRCICKSYRPHISVSFLAKQLGFPSEKLCVDFLESCDAEFIDDGKRILDTQGSQKHFLARHAVNKVDESLPE